MAVDGGGELICNNNVPPRRSLSARSLSQCVQILSAPLGVCGIEQQQKEEAFQLGACQVRKVYFIPKNTPQHYLLNIFMFHPVPFENSVLISKLRGPRGPNSS